MKLILFGATGMVGQGALHEALADPHVEAVLAVGRSAAPVTNPKLTQITTPDLFHLAAFEQQLSGYDACLFCLGVSSLGMSEADYRHLTYDLTISVAQTLVRLNPAMTFIYVSGEGTDSSERGRLAWARIKGATENALLRMPFRAAYMFRPGYIHPVHGFTGKTTWVRAGYAVFSWLYPLAKAIVPTRLLTTKTMAQAMLRAARLGAPRQILAAVDINHFLSNT